LTVTGADVTDAAVRPVIDYEPQISGLGAERYPAVAAAQVVGVAPLKLRLAGPVPPSRRPAGPPPAPSPRSPQYRAAAAFVDAALRTILEVIDLRRPPGQLRPLMAAGLADSVIAFTRTMAPRRAGAVVRRVRLQACDSRELAFEIAAAYSREPRLHAIACRVQQISTAQGPRWQIVALHIG
jgi:hypothetical protein